MAVLWILNLAGWGIIPDVKPWSNRKRAKGSSVWLKDRRQEEKVSCVAATVKKAGWFLFIHQYCRTDGACGDPIMTLSTILSPRCGFLGIRAVGSSVWLKDRRQEEKVSCVAATGKKQVDGFSSTNTIAPMVLAVIQSWHFQPYCRRYAAFWELEP